MKSSTIDIENLQVEPVVTSMNNAAIIYTAIEVSKRSGVPMLFLSNPGAGKTSAIYKFAEQNGYYVESLILSQYSQDEILGFQANTGKDHLEILEPEWFYRISEKEKDGVPSILFLDELSTVDGPRQGAGLQLCFERRIRGGKKLPDSCIVVSAANYKQNLPGYTDIISPTLNRFCIINLLPGELDSDANSIAFQTLREAMQSFTTPDFVVPKFNNDFKLTSAQEADFLKTSQSNFSQLFARYTKRGDSERGILDMRNVRYDGIFDREDGIPEVYNFISIRSLSYYNRVVKSLAEMGVESSNPVIHKFVDGLIGLGTNSWTEDSVEAKIAQLEAYHIATYNMTASLINKFKPSVTRKIKPKTEEPEVEWFDKNTLAGNINSFIQASIVDEQSFSGAEFVNLISAIWKKYDNSPSKIKENLENVLNSEDGILKFRVDYEAIQLLVSEIDTYSKSNSGLSFYSKKLKAILESYNYYYSSSVVNVDESQLNF